MPPGTTRTTAWVVFYGAFAVRSALADPQGLSTFVPVQTEDAYTLHRGELQLQGVSRFTKDTHDTGGHDLWNLAPAVKYGATENLELIVGTDYAVGNQSGANQGAGSIAALYQISPNTKFIPAFAVQAGYDTPYGAGHKISEYSLKGIATKNLGTSDAAPRLDFNVIWTHRTQAEGSTRGDQVEFGFAYSMLVSSDTAIVIDYVHGDKPTRHKDENIIDVGFRHEVTPDLAFSAGVGVGISGNSPDYRFILAIQKSFQLF